MYAPNMALIIAQILFVIHMVDYGNVQAACLWQGGNWNHVRSAELSYLYFYPHEVVSRYRHTQH